MNGSSGASGTQNGIDVGNNLFEQEVHVLVDERRSQNDVCKETKGKESRRAIIEEDINQTTSASDSQLNNTTHERTETSKANVPFTIEVTSVEEEATLPGLKPSGISQSNHSIHTSKTYICDTHSTENHSIHSTEGNNVQYSEKVPMLPMASTVGSNIPNGHSIRLQNVDSNTSQLDVDHALSLENQGSNQSAICKHADTTQSVPVDHSSNSKWCAPLTQTCRLGTNASSVKTDQGCSRSSISKENAVSLQGTSKASNLSEPVNKNTSKVTDNQYLGYSDKSKSHAQSMLVDEDASKANSSQGTGIISFGDSVTIPKPTRVVNEQMVVQIPSQRKTNATTESSTASPLLTQRTTHESTSNVDHLTQRIFPTPSRITTPQITTGPGLAPCPDGILCYRPRRKDGGAHWYRASAVILSCHK